MLSQSKSKKKWDQNHSKTTKENGDNMAPKYEKPFVHKLVCCFGANPESKSKKDNGCDSPRWKLLGQETTDQGDVYTESFKTAGHMSSRKECFELPTQTDFECSNDGRIQRSQESLYHPGNSRTQSLQLDQECLNPILLAASEVVSASKLLSNAIEALKRTSLSINLNDSTTSVSRGTPRPNEAAKWDSEAVSKTDCCAEMVLDLPPINTISQIEARTVIPRADLFHRAESNVRICIEDTDAIELIRHPITDEEEEEYISQLKDVLSLPPTDVRLKSSYPTSVSTQSPQLTFTLPDDSRRVHHAVEHTKCDMYSNGQLLTTGIYRPHSTDEAQFTEVDECLSTDESDESTHRPQSNGPLISKQKGHYDNCRFPPNIPREIQSCTGDFQTLSRDLNHTPSKDVASLKIPMDSRDISMTNAYIGDHSIPIRHIKPRQHPTETGMKLDESKFRDSSPLSQQRHALLDNEDISFEVMYQRNNHNRKLNVGNESSDIELPIKYALTSRHFRKSNNSIRFLTESVDTSSCGNNATGISVNLFPEEVTKEKEFASVSKGSPIFDKVVPNPDKGHRTTCSIEVDLAPDSEPITTKLSSTPNELPSTEKNG